MSDILQQQVSATTSSDAPDDSATREAIAVPFLSVVVPAYNEIARLPSTLAAIDRFIGDLDRSVEVIVADDGSSDGTADIADARRLRASAYRVLRLPHRGKAGAVRAGMLAASGSYVLFTDADLSTPMRFAEELIAALADGADVAIGSREGVGARRDGEPAYRHIMGRAFNGVVRVLAVPGIKDTQCGFKAFRSAAARDLFSSVRLHTDGPEVDGPRVTGFDVEVLYLARRRGYRIAEIPVFWQHVPGSKVNPIPDAFRMFADVVRVRVNALLGRYD
jgi:glycosyltransferase involved in cell wall biosynthesis